MSTMKPILVYYTSSQFLGVRAENEKISLIQVMNVTSNLINHRFNRVQ